MSVLVFLGLGYSLVARTYKDIGNPPTDFPAENIELKSKTGSSLRGWFAKGVPGRGGVLLLHGIRSDRLGMLGRARFLNRLGYAVLLIDLQAHGESEGYAITLGREESRDAEAALEYLSRRIESTKLFAIGQSLGGAALLLSAQPIPVRALVVEAVFPDLDRAVTNRLWMRIGFFAPLVSKLLLLELQWILGIDPQTLRPIDRIAKIGCPVFVISGDEDKHTTVPETRELYQKAASPRELWLVQGAAHVDLHRFAGKEYEERVSAFFDKFATESESETHFTSEPMD